MPDNAVELKIDVEVLKEKIDNITHLCGKMDQIIEKLVDNQDRIVTQIYNDIERRKRDTMEDIKELHSRITTVDRNLSDKIELTERRIMDEIKSLRHTIDERNKKEDSELRKILEWKWMIAGAIIILTWMISNVNLASFGALFGK
jgi:prefoldin subunit 5